MPDTSPRPSAQEGGRLRFAVIGAGINGAAVARELTRRYPAAEVTVFEKADRVAAHQTGHNSGVVHAGLYYEPGSLKARLCRRGVGLLRDYATARGLPYEECGKLVVALEEAEEERLRSIHARAVANGVPGVRLIGPEEIRAIEPNAVGRLALHSPTTAITDFAAIARSLISDVEEAGGRIELGAEVVGMDVSARQARVTVRRAGGGGAGGNGAAGSGVRGAQREGSVRTEAFDFVIACAGLQSDRVGALAGGATYPRIVPFFGQYSQLEGDYRTILSGLVYPVPDPAYPFLGVHLTKRVDGEMLVGPNAFLSFGRENYSGWRIGVRDSLAVAADPGFWRFAAGNAQAAVREFGAVVSRQRFLAGAAAYVPGLTGAGSRPITRGIRAQAMDADGGLVDDFVIEHVERATVVRNAPSPGATSSMAIAEHILDTAAEVHGLG